MAGEFALASDSHLPISLGITARGGDLLLPRRSALSLRSKVVALLLTVFAIYAIVEHSVQRWVLMPSFVTLERATATRNMDRGIEAIQREAELLLPSARYWGTWDDSYRYMRDRNQEFVKVNLSFPAMKSLGVNFLGLYDAQGHTRWARGFDLTTEHPVDIGLLASAALPDHHPLLGAPGSTESWTGMMRIPAGALLVASTPILRSDGRGPARGRVVMGRFLDQAAITRLGNQARVQLRVEAIESHEARGMPVTRPGNAVAFTPVAMSEDDDVTYGTTTALDLSGVPILRLEVTTPRTIVAQGMKTLHYATGSLLIAGMGVLLALMVLLRRTVLDPVSRLTHHVTTVGASDLTARLNMNRSDELGILAKEFDRMVEHLAEARERLLEQSFKSGVAEMASGVLHNIGNAITPVGVKLMNLKNELKGAPVAELDMAVAELSDPGTPVDRRAALNRFLTVAAPAVASLVGRTLGELDALQSQVRHVQDILADQQRFSRTERVMEPLELHRLLNETVSLLPEGLSGNTRIEIDPRLATIGTIRSSRVALQQVLSNLLINAAEAIREGGLADGAGLIRIRETSSGGDTSRDVHLCIEDNGVGIPGEHLDHIFEAGFSTKSRGSGMGLHWSANTVSGLGGRIYAESDGAMRGARLHIVLPRGQAHTQPREKAA